jgi:hypothetical protein
VPPARITQVQSDVTTTLTAMGTQCPAGCVSNTAIRRITYLIVDSSNNAIAFKPIIREQFQTKSAETCGTSIQTSESCTITTGLGTFTDRLTVGCNTVGGSCGHTYTQQQWQWCPTTGSPVPIGTPGDIVVHNDNVTVGGNLIGFIPGSYIY